MHGSGLDPSELAQGIEAILMEGQIFGDGLLVPFGFTGEHFLELRGQGFMTMARIFEPFNKLN